MVNPDKVRTRRGLYGAQRVTILFAERAHSVVVNTSPCHGEDRGFDSPWARSAKKSPGLPRKLSVSENVRGHGEGTGFSINSAS